VRTQLAGFASNHGQPDNLMCLAYGADPVTFADLTEDGYLPPNRCQAASVVARGTRAAAGKGLAHRRVGNDFRPKAVLRTSPEPHSISASSLGQAGR
jgi:hypothetical protein